MKLQELQLVNFKNHSDLKFSFNQEINCFVGNNGVGKTNILDAIHYISSTKSYFNSNDQNTIKFNENFFNVKGSFIDELENLNEIICYYDNVNRKVVKKNQKKYKKFSDHIGSFPSVFITPTDLKLIEGTSDIRRRFIDYGISQYNPKYLNYLISYNKALKQRNSLLKQFIKTGIKDIETLEIYNNLLDNYGTYIYKIRNEYKNKIVPLIQKLYSLISSNKEQADLKYDSQLVNMEFKTLLQNALEKDLISTYTSVGIHKDEFLLTLDNNLVKTYGSQGQQKSFLISIKLAQLLIIKELKGFSPILILDDLFDRLDISRVSQLIDIISKENISQVFITDTDEKRVKSLFAKKNYEIFYI